MKTLPKYFVIKCDMNNDLWVRYIKWLNEMSLMNYDGDVKACFYGYDGNSDNNGTNLHPFLQNFQNNPTVITIEEWDECVNGVKEVESRGYFTFQNWTL